MSIHDDVYQQKRDHIIIEATHQLLKTKEGWLGTPLNAILQPIGEFFDVDRITLCLFERTEQAFYQVNEWCHIGIQPRKVRVFPFQGAHSHDVMNKIQSSYLHLHEIKKEDLGQTWLSYVINEDVKSLLIYPLQRDQQLIGYVTCENVRRAHDFADIPSPVFDLFIKVLEMKIITYLLKEEQLTQEVISTSKQSHQYAFVANVSHEIRTPLNGIHNALYLLQTTDLTKDQKEYIDMGQRSADHLSTMVDRILDLEALESGKMDIQKRAFNLEDELVRLIHM